MHSQLVYSVVVLALAILVFSPKDVKSECCKRTQRTLCGNCKKPDFGKVYCGKGDCNIFGCNCDGGCLEGSCRGRRSLEDQANGYDDFGIDTGHDAIRLADTDADGALNVTEMKVYLGRLGIVVEIDAFRALDIDGNGKLTAREIDADIL